MEHTCGGTPNDDNRILPDCEGCYAVAYNDGARTAWKAGVTHMEYAMRAAILSARNPLLITEKSVAIEMWKCAKEILAMVEREAATSRQADDGKYAN